MITRRKFLKRAGAALVALSVGIKPRLQDDLALTISDTSGITALASQSTPNLDNFNIQGGYIVPDRYREAILYGSSFEKTTPLAATWEKPLRSSALKLDKKTVKENL